MQSYSKDILKVENDPDGFCYIFSNFQREMADIEQLRSLIDV
ncbi:uncharacterized protein METZ01_LOCUS361618 [marine metagenome]|uniref:Uncharacterized protein n=1 Tax=marine metagenome TaxID=408172 RepID=A0A382SFS8_9ZZZZ